VELARLTDVPAYDDEHVVAHPLLAAPQCNVRVIRLAAGQALPPHTHGTSDLMLYVTEGEGVLAAPGGDVAFTTGTLAHLRGDERLEVTNTGTVGMTLLAFLAPPFPPSAGG
jgi:quercetin dioxygenase-like cupin family protein